MIAEANGILTLSLQRAQRLVMAKNPDSPGKWIIA